MFEKLQWEHEVIATRSLLLTQCVMERGRIVFVDAQQSVHGAGGSAGVAEADARHWHRDTSPGRERVSAESVSKSLADGRRDDFQGHEKEDEMKWRGVARREIHFLLLLVPRISFTFARPLQQLRQVRSRAAEVRVRLCSARQRLDTSASPRLMSSADRRGSVCG